MRNTKAIDNEAVVRMVQLSRGCWEIQTRHGYVLKGDLQFGSKTEAEGYVRAYLSSFQCWNYELVPLRKSKK